MTNPDEVILHRFVEALAARDRPALESTLDTQVRLRALLPRRSVDLNGAAAVAAELLDWFEEVSEIVPVRTQIDRVGDVWHAGYQFSLLGLDVERVTEQHAYCAIEGGLITRVALLCSGFRPVHAGGQRLDALGEGCATLTPRISATMRSLASGEILAVLTDDPSAGDDLAAWSRLTGHQIVGNAAEDAGTRYYIRRKS